MSALHIALEIHVRARYDVDLFRFGSNVNVSLVLLIAH